MNPPRAVGPAVTADSPARQPYWAVDQGIAYPTTPAVPEVVDVGVIGGGFTGLSAALHLAHKGARVAVFERNSLGSGASVRNGGMCTTGATLPFTTLVRRYGPTVAGRLFLAYNTAIDLVESLVRREAIDCGFARWGKLVLASKPQHLARFQAEHDALHEHLGYHTAVLSAADLVDEVRTGLYYGGHLDARGAGLHPGRLARGLAAAAARNGATLHEHTPVLAYTRSGSRFVLRTPRGQVRATHLVIATNGYTEREAPYFRRRVVPVRAASIATESLEPALASDLMPTGRMTTDSSNLLTYFRITPDHRVLIGGRASYAVPQARAFQANIHLCRTKLVEIFPALAEVRVEYAWTGLTGFTLDRIPHAGEHAGAFYSLGYCGHGVPMAVFMGATMADMLDGNDQANPWRGMPFRAVPMYFGHPWFVPLTNIYYQIKDRIR